MGCARIFALNNIIDKLSFLSGVGAKRQTTISLRQIHQARLAEPPSRVLKTIASIHQLLVTVLCIETGRITKAEEF